MTKKQEARSFKFKVGCDPEFVLTAVGKKLVASSVFNELYDKANAVDMGFKVGEKGIIGWDGCSSTGEIRPNPAENVEEVADNLEAMFSDFAKKTRLIRMESVSDRAAVGGHIHLELPDKLKERVENGTASTTLNNYTKKLATMWLPLMMGESRVNLSGRMRTGYGKLTDHRNGENTLEFRCPTGEWMTTRKICVSTLCYMAVVWNEILSDSKVIKKNKDIFISTESQADAIQKLAISDLGSMTDAIVSRISSMVKKFELYEQFKEEIDYIIDYKKVFADKKKVGYDILTGWNIQAQETKTNKSDFSGKKKMQAIAKEKNLDGIGSCLSITFNGDMAVESFAKELSRRVVAFNMPINNQYVLFGLRKGINDVLTFDANKKIYHGSMIKTQKDLDLVNDGIIKNMHSKYFRVNPANNNKYEWKYAKKTAPSPTMMFIGIPYSDRVNGSFKRMLEAFYMLNEKKIEGKDSKEIALHFVKAKEGEEPASKLQEIMEGKETIDDRATNGDLVDKKSGMSFDPNDAPVSPRDEGTDEDEIDELLDDATEMNP